MTLAHGWSRISKRIRFSPFSSIMKSFCGSMGPDFLSASDFLSPDFLESPTWAERPRPTASPPTRRTMSPMRREEYMILPRLLGRRGDEASPALAPKPEQPNYVPENLRGGTYRFRATV